MINVLVVGAGKWAHECWAPLLRDHAERFQVVAVADRDHGLARSLGQQFGLAPDVCFRSVDQALASRETIDIHAGIVVCSPDEHAPVIVRLADAGLDLLSEKPLATDHAGLTAITAAIGRRIKAAVIQNARDQNRIQHARRILSDGELGRLRYIVARFAADYRKPGSWDVGDAHTMDDPLLIEAAIHHLDMIRYLAQADITSVAAVTINPEPTSFVGDCIGGLLATLDNGTFALYEGNLLAAGSENRWRNEYYRAECSGGAVVCDEHLGHEPQAVHVPDVDMFDGHRRQLAAFADWLDGGPPVATTVADNTRSIAAVLAALDSTQHRTTRTVLREATRLAQHVE